MKITVITSSSHKNGSSNLLASSFIRGAEEKGHTVSVFDAGHSMLHPCIGCGRCGMNGNCIQKDDGNRLRDLVLSSDMMVLVTPLYYYGFSAQMKAVIDRWYSYTARLSSKHMKTALIVAAWNSNDWTMKDIREHYLTLCRYMNFENAGMILGTGCGSPEMTRGTEFSEKAYRLGKSL